MFRCLAMVCQRSEAAAASFLGEIHSKIVNLSFVPCANLIHSDPLTHILNTSEQTSALESERFTLLIIKQRRKVYAFSYEVNRRVNTN